MRTQWNVGFAGPVGLRYEALQLAMELENVPRSDWDDVMDGIQVMEYETLRIWREKR